MNIYYNLKLEDIKERIDSLSKFYESFRKYFRSKTRDVSSQGMEYIKGLLLCEGR